jgi:hypothetical protein
MDSTRFGMKKFLGMTTLCPVMVFVLSTLPLCGKLIPLAALNFQMVPNDDDSSK